MTSNLYTTLRKSERESEVRWETGTVKRHNFKAVEISECLDAAAAESAPSVGHARKHALRAYARNCLTTDGKGKQVSGGSGAPSE